ncbi:hypothetical protein ISN44_As11g033120 [Arabidopsis suecica]|uniref:Uncharacterized protein n=1 Tax=Arabidopsis suecica TaxID=45249 RepID=A0A8T1ZF65_ARASU|nr:hypothetical protein ISN44_As11g033120 [Arabidopsis suecica]
MNSLFSMFDSFFAEIMRNKFTSKSSSHGPSTSSSGVQAVSMEKTTKKILVGKALRFAPEYDGLHCFETIVPS